MSRVQSPQPPEDELPFLSKMLSKDVKNYHVWSYRHWLVRHFNLWPSLTDPEVKNTELELVDTLLKMDVRNNSAWNHRFFCIFGREDGKEVAEAVVEREIKLAKEKIELAPQNLSAWNYLKGVLRKRKDGPNIKEELEEFSVRFANLEDVEGISSSHAMDFLAEIWAEKGEAEKASKALDLLAERLDPVRKNYWNWRKSQIQVEGKA